MKKSDENEAEKMDLLFIVHKMCHKECKKKAKKKRNGCQVMKNSRAQTVSDSQNKCTTRQFANSMAIQIN